MSGLSGMSVSGSMPRNCGMEGMHLKSTDKQPEKNQQSEQAHKHHHANQITDNLRGNKIDLKV